VVSYCISGAGYKLAACMLVSCSGYFSTLKIEAICSSETLVDSQWTWRYIPENGTLHNHRCGKGKAITVTGHGGP
jgi:hypothetical protein